MAQTVGSDLLSTPRLVTQHSLRETKVRQKEKTTLSGDRILVAEDNPVNQMVALGQLHNLGYRAEAVANGREVLKAMEKESYGIILMDCQMPLMDGFEATAEIRHREGTARRTPIIALTANALQGDQEKCLAAGMDDYLSKPLKSDALRWKLEQWIKPTKSAGFLREQPAWGARTSSDQPVNEENMPNNQDHHLAVDLSVLTGLREFQQPGEPDFITELIDLFLNDAASLLKLLHAAVSGNDADELRRVAHRLKGSSSNIGAVRMATLTEKLEEKGLGQEDAEALRVKLENEFARVSEALTAERREP
jgi:CheY-like chemotaxis protein